MQGLVLPTVTKYCHDCKFMCSEHQDLLYSNLLSVRSLVQLIPADLSLLQHPFDDPVYSVEKCFHLLRFEGKEGMTKGREPGKTSDDHLLTDVSFREKVTRVPRQDLN